MPEPEDGQIQAAPRHETAARAGELPVDIRGWLRTAFESYWAFLWQSTSALLILFGVLGGTLIFIAAASSAGGLPRLLIPVALVACALGLPAFLVGYQFAAVLLLRGEPSWVSGALAAIGRRFFPLAYLGFLLGLGPLAATAALFVVGGLGWLLLLLVGLQPDEHHLPIDLAALAVLAASVLLLWRLSARWGFAGLLVIDRGMGAAEALRASWRMTHNREAWMMAFKLLLAALVAGGLSAMVIGVVATAPLAALAHAAAYLTATGQPAPLEIAALTPAPPLAPAPASSGIETPRRGG